MDSHTLIFSLCILWIFGYSAAFTTGCCQVTWTAEDTKVTCSGCGLRDVPKDLPINTTELNLRNNSLSILHKECFVSLVSLKFLILSMNDLSAILTGAFDNLRNLEYLDLSENNLNLHSFDTLTFRYLKNLKRLKIQKNNFHVKRSYPERALSHLSQLEYLIIDIFEGFHFGIGFLNLTNLNSLHFNFIGKEYISFRNSSFQGLRDVNISYLNIAAPIRKIEVDFLSPFRRLTSFRFDSRRTITIQEVLLTLYGLRGRTLESLALTANALMFDGIKTLVKSDLLYLGTMCVKKLDLSLNSIGSITMEAILSWTKRTCVEVLNLSKNQFYSAQIISFLNLFPSITYVDISYIQYFSVRKRSAFLEERVIFIPKTLKFLIITHNPLSGPVINVTFSNNNHLHVLDISYPTRPLSCSHGLLCKGLVHLKEFDMSGIDCSNPNPEMFTVMSNLTRLAASQCNLNENFSSRRTSLLKGLYYLSFVNMSSNAIKTLNIGTFKDQRESLKTLILAKNVIKRVPIKALQYLNVLETLDISNNLISTLRASEYSQLDVFKTKSEKFRIYLSGNPLVCNCDNLDFLSWIATTQVIYDKDELVCITPEGSNMKIRKFLETFDQFQEGCVSQSWLIVSMVLLVILFAGGILSRESWRRSIWLRVKCRRPLEHDRYPYDIFISYCNEDSGWVAKTFIPWLDQNEIKYCFEDKSFNPGHGICDNIMDAIDDSRQTVFVVSCSFLEREWTMFTMKLASEYSFRDGRQNMNIIIMLDDIKRSEFPKLMRRNLDAIRPLRWPSGRNMDQEKLVTAAKRFWTKMLKLIQRESVKFPSANISESSV